MTYPHSQLALVFLMVALAQDVSLVAAESKAPRGWDPEKAAQYLDERMDIWLAKATPLRTDQGKTACLTCHTIVPYALARPRLRQAMGVSQPTAQETKLLEITERRAATAATHQPLYGNKEKQSRGTEAILNAIILAQRDAAQQRRQPSEPLRQALAELWETQHPEGGWDWLDAGVEPYESKGSAFYGAVLAALAVGTAPGVIQENSKDAQDYVRQLGAYLRQQAPEESLYNRAWLLLAAVRWSDLLTLAQREAVVAELKKRQRDDGGWSLAQLGPWKWSKTNPPFKAPGKVDSDLLEQSDGYATGLAVLALRQAGVPSDQAQMQRAKTWLQANQRECEIDGHRWKCWRAYSLNHDREHGGSHGELWPRMFMSDAATAFAVLALLSYE